MVGTKSVWKVGLTILTNIPIIATQPSHTSDLRQPERTPKSQWATSFAITLHPERQPISTQFGRRKI